jgi:hypothetical protein
MKQLHTVSLTRLSMLEFGQHVKSVVNGISDLGKGNTLIVDTNLKNYLAKSRLEIVEYDKGMLQIKKSDETAKIVAADALRDKAITALLRYLNVFELSEIETETLAHASLDTLVKKYNGIQRWNFEEESNGIDNLIEDLNSNKYLEHVNLLKMSDYVTRVTNRNNEFKTIFASRTQEVAIKEVFDVKKLRATMKSTYSDMVDYVVSMSKIQDNEEFNQSLNVINTVRKYYADLLAKRKPATATAPEVPIPPMA